jgi:hypothetical protein
VLAQNYPFVFGITLYPSFYADGVARTKPKTIIPMPDRETEMAFSEGHAVVAVG